MIINEQWVPVITESVKWVKDSLSPSKKELKLKIEDLEKQVKDLSYGNQFILQNMVKIMGAIFNQLRKDGHYSINSKYITINNQVRLKDNRVIEVNNENSENTKKQISDIFYGIDEEIQYSKLVRPSERR